MNPDELLDIARLTGLRQHLHGLNATATREILARFADELEARQQRSTGALLGREIERLLERVRPGSEAAPWVVRELEAIAYKARPTIHASTPSGRRRFQGQGELERTGYIERNAYEPLYAEPPKGMPPRWVDQQPKPAPTRYKARNPQRHDWTCRHCGRPEEEHARTVVRGKPASCRTEHRHIHAWAQEQATTATPNPDYVDADRHTPTPRRRRTDQDRTA